MTETQAKKLIKLAVIQQLQAAPADAEDIADAALNTAVTSIGKLDSVDFNTEFVSDTLTSGTYQYVLGVDLFPDFTSVWNIREMGRTDTPGWPINIVRLDDFKAYWRGNTVSGPPAEGTIYKRDDAYILELAPRPDSDYPIEAKVKHSVTQFEEIPATHHDVVVSVAINIVNATRDPNLALTLARMGIRDIQNDSPVAWDGSVIPIDRPLGVGTSGNGRIDSGRLR